MVSFESWAQRDREFRFLIERHFPNESGEAVSLVLTCPKFHEAPIIAALTGFEAVCGYPSGAFIGKNCRFMNRGLPNNKENMSELRAIQESPESAREFMAKNPKGKQYLLRNKRPARMSERENVTGRTPYTPMPSNDILEADASCFIEFFNQLHVFGFEVERANYPKTPILVGVQFVLTSVINRKKAQKLAHEVQELLIDPNSNVRDVFLEWSRLALTLYEEYNDWVESGTPPKGAGPFSGSSETPQIPGLMQSLSMSTPSSRDAVHATKSTPSSKTESTRADESTDVRSENDLKDGTKTKAKHQLFEHELQSAIAESDIFDYDSGKDCGQNSLALIPVKSPNPLDASSKGMHRAKPTPLSGFSTAEKLEKTPNDARHLIEKIKLVESIASTWATEKKDKQSSGLVEELVTLREALCDDFAADLNLYIAFYCASRELQEE
jgi:hypothetical protein